MKKTLIVIAIAALAAATWFGGYRAGQTKTAETQPLAALEAAIALQPRQLQANLWAVTGAHKAGADEDLGSILIRYAIAKREQLNRQSPDKL
jgi:hypothetical protein